MGSKLIDCICIMSNMDPYEVLGVERSASVDEIRKAVKLKSVEMHPDKNPNDPDASAKFMKITAAKDILLDEDRKMAYDLGGTEGLEEYNRKQEFMRHVRQQRSMKRADPIETMLALKLTDIYHCNKKTVKVDVYTENDAGEREVTEKELPVPVNTNFEFGKTFVIRGEGNSKPDHINGDVLVTIFEEGDDEVDKFSIDGYDLVYNCKLSPEEIICGYDFCIRHPDGKTYRLHADNALGDFKESKTYDGHGLPMPRPLPDRTHGNMIVKFELDLSSLSKMEPSALADLGKIMKGDPATRAPERYHTEDVTELNPEVIRRPRRGGIEIDGMEAVDFDLMALLHGQGGGRHRVERRADSGDGKSTRIRIVRGSR